MGNNSELSEKENQVFEGRKKKFKKFFKWFVPDYENQWMEGVHIFDILFGELVEGVDPSETLELTVDRYAESYKLGIERFNQLENFIKYEKDEIYDVPSIRWENSGYFPLPWYLWEFKFELEENLKEIVVRTAFYALCKAEKELKSHKFPKPYPESEKSNKILPENPASEYHRTYRDKRRQMEKLFADYNKIELLDNLENNFIEYGIRYITENKKHADFLLKARAGNASIEEYREFFEIKQNKKYQKYDSPVFDKILNESGRRYNPLTRKRLPRDAIISEAVSDFRRNKSKGIDQKFTYTETDGEKASKARRNNIKEDKRAPYKQLEGGVSIDTYNEDDVSDIYEKCNDIITAYPKIKYRRILWTYFDDRYPMYLKNFRNNIFINLYEEDWKPRWRTEKEFCRDKVSQSTWRDIKDHFLKWLASQYRDGGPEPLIKIFGKPINLKKQKKPFKK